MDVYWNFILWIENTPYQTHSQQVTNAGKDMDRREPSFTSSGNVNSWLKSVHSISESNIILQSCISILKMHVEHS